MTRTDRPLLVLSRYALFDEIARGGMATVHIGRLAGAAGFAKTVAIKRMHSNLANNPDFVGMFVDEARLAGRLQHPNVVNVFDVVARDHEAFLVMEFVLGESLSTLLKRQRSADEPFPVEIAVQVVRDALYGLHAAHVAKDEKGQSLELVHRDVSPQNILVGVDGVARVLDFGIAKAVGRIQESSTGELKGKIAYMAPEQVIGHAIDRRADVYAAGVVLWEALAGRRLFSGENSAELVYRVLEEQVPDLRELRPGVSEGLAHAVHKAMSKRRDDRFVSAEHFAKELEECSRVLPPGQVGNFVRRVGGVQLEERRARVAEIEALALEDAGGMPSAPELTSRPSNPDVTASLIVAGVGEVTVVERPVTSSHERPPVKNKRLVRGVAGGVALAAAIAVVIALRQTGAEPPALVEASSHAAPGPLPALPSASASRADAVVQRPEDFPPEASAPSASPSLTPSPRVGRAPVSKTPAKSPQPQSGSKPKVEDLFSRE